VPEGQDGPPKKQLSISLDRADYSRFDMAAKANHRTMAGEIRHLIAGAIEQFEAEVRRAA